MNRSIYLASCSVVLSVCGIGAAWAATMDVLAFSRMGERILVVLGAGLCLWIGYRLFRQAGLPSTTDASSAASAATNAQAAASGGNFEGQIGSLVSVKMLNVGPGIFFALFGAALLAYVLSSSVEINILVPAKDGKPATEVHAKFNFPGLSAEASADRAGVIVRAIRTIDDRLTGPSRDTSIDTALLNLNESKRYIIDVGLGEGAYQTYSRLQAMSDADRAHASQADRDIYQKVFEALNGGIR